MDHDQLRCAARQIVAEILELGDDEVRDDAPFSELGADSIQQMEIVAALRARFGVHFTLNEESRLGTVDDAVAITAAHLRA